MFLSQNTVWIFTLDNVSKSKITTKSMERFLSFCQKFWQKYLKNIENRYFSVLMCTCTLMCTTLFSSTRYELAAAGWCDSLAFNVFELRFKETGFTTQWQTKGKQARRLIWRFFFIRYFDAKKTSLVLKLRMSCCAWKFPEWVEATVLDGLEFLSKYIGARGGLRVSQCNSYRNAKNTTNCIE